MSACQCTQTALVGQLPHSDDDDDFDDDDDDFDDDGAIYKYLPTYENVLQIFGVVSANMLTPPFFYRVL